MTSDLWFGLSNFQARFCTFKAYYSSKYLERYALSAARNREVLGVFERESMNTSNRFSTIVHAPDTSDGLLRIARKLRAAVSSSLVVKTSQSHSIRRPRGREMTS